MSLLLTVGVSHKTAPVELRERVALTEGLSASVLADLKLNPAIEEVVAISTCNRTEIYMLTDDPVAAESDALSTLAKKAELSPTELADHLYVLRDFEVARHLFRVAAGLESMILGEAEIQGQVKRAYELSLVEGATGLISNRLFRGALAAGKRVRSETELGKMRTSVSSTAVELAADLGDLRKHHVLVIGAGKTGELTAKALIDRGVETVYVANRRYERAVGLAQRFGAEALRFDQLPDELLRADIVVSGTSSPHKIVDHEELALLMDQRNQRPLLVIDTAVPRDFDPAVRSIPGVRLYDMDDLQKLVERKASGQRQEELKAELVVEKELSSFEHWVASLEVLPTITDLREFANALVEQVIADNQDKWESASDSDLERINKLAFTIANRLLHNPTDILKQSVKGDVGHIYTKTVRELFGLDNEERQPTEIKSVSQDESHT